MIELLIVIALATIGVYFTTTTEAFSRARSHDDDYESDGEDEGGIGILGVDIARKVVGRGKSRRVAPPADSPIAVYEAEIAPKYKAAQSDPEAARLAAQQESMVDAAVRSVMKEFDLGGERAYSAETEAEDDTDARDEAEHEPEAAPEAVMAEADAPDAAPVQDDAPAFDEEDEAADDAIAAAIRAEMEERRADAESEAAEAARPASRARRDSPPIIEDFDPDEDRIVVGYYRDEAGDGRIGISEDPVHPGTARIMVGGRVAALVPGGYGFVQAHHVELELLDKTSAA
ncbi:MAG: hypothetical protein ACU0DK_10680 [Pseudooceanicola sp.]